MEMRRPIFAANWKMNKTIIETEEYIERFAELLTGAEPCPEIVVIPPYTALAYAEKIIDSLGIGKQVLLGAQNLFWEDIGAFTGEVCAEMLVDAGCTYVVIGHSERRSYFLETDEIVNKKIAAALKSGLKPIICIGETKDQRQSGKTFSVLEKQIKGALDYFENNDLANIVIAYEPVWAIGTGLTASPEQVQEAHLFIRNQVRNMFGTDLADNIRIQYGGSVKPDNVKTIMGQSDVDGSLVGGASLDPDSFFSIISFDRK
jgi:triosephosphate isomerase